MNLRRINEIIVANKNAGKLHACVTVLPPKLDRGEETHETYIGVYFVLDLRRRNEFQQMKSESPTKTQAS